MPVVETEFDGILAEDIILEEVDGDAETKAILAHAENIYKANLYLRELFTQAPVFNEVVSFKTVETSGKQTLSYLAETNLIMFKNLKDSESKVYLGEGYLVLMPFETFEFPISEGMTLAIDGRFSIVETKYN